MRSSLYVNYTSVKLLKIKEVEKGINDKLLKSSDDIKVRTIKT